MNDPKPELEGQYPTGSPIVNKTRMEATNSQIGNAAQLVNSPGAVVYQVYEQQSSAVPGILVGMFGVLLLLLVAVLSLLGKVVPRGLAVPLVGFSSALIVGGFFSCVESLLKSVTKSEIAGWLIGVKVGQKLEPWPETFARVFERVFGTKHFSWRCISRSTIASVLCGLGGLIFMLAHGDDPLMDKTFGLVFTVLPFSVTDRIHGLLFGLGSDQNERAIAYRAVVFGGTFVLLLIANVVPDYFSLLVTRIILRLMRRHSVASGTLLYLILDTTLTLGTAIVWNILLFTQISMADGIQVGEILSDGTSSVRTYSSWLVYPALFTSIWLWLYAGSGFLLKAARRFDIGFRWFNEKFDIENKPLSAIGLVAGALVALVYWGVAIGAHFLR